MNFFKKLLLLPTPAELGRSDGNYLPSRLLNRHDEKDGKYYWEDYYDEMKEKYPIKYFLSQTLTAWWRRWIWGTYAPLERARYWLISHLISSRKYHLLDLRQPEKDGYQFGWLDSDRQIEYACFNILRNYVEKELPHCYVKQEFTKEELKAEPSLRAQKKHFDDIKIIYRYWTVEKKELEKNLDILRDKWYNTSKKKEADKLFKFLKEEEKRVEDLKDKMLIKLIKTRKGMWS